MPSLLRREPLSLPGCPLRSPFQSGLGAMRGQWHSSDRVRFAGVLRLPFPPGPSVLGVLLVYLVTLLGSSPIILLTLADTALHSPMYFFLRHFSGWRCSTPRPWSPGCRPTSSPPAPPSRQPAALPSCLSSPGLALRNWPAPCHGL